MPIEKMDAIVWDGSVYPKGLSYEKVDIPRPPKGWVLVHNRAAGICGADLMALRGQTRDKMPDELFPAVLGHENAGDVVEIGEGVTKVKVGDRVAVEPLHGCIDFGKSCPMCLSGRYQLCLDGVTHVGMPMKRMLPGGYGEYSIVHENHVYPMPDSMSYEEGAILDVLAVNVHGAMIGKPKLGDSVAVVGCGIIGINMIQVLRTMGISKIIAVAKYGHQAKMAETYGASDTIVLDDGVNAVEEVMRLTNGRGVDQAYECVGGNSNAFSQAVGMAAVGGKIIMFGGTADPSMVSLSTILYRELSVLASSSYCMAGDKPEFQIAMELVTSGQVDHKGVITHRFRPEEYERAFEMIFSKKNNNICKAVWVRD